ncbi:MAG: hypothetical protein MSB10_02505 [Clostridiales bacterium]|uniref:hypothetical protein n=1 Tax=Flavonifractor porci TaxID=3133422 RepID=UPI0030A88D6E|nr:hypothetical protein [Clostridiales bacterium]
MLNDAACDRSFRSVRSFAEACGGSPDSFYQKVDALVHCNDNDREYLYRGIDINISYHFGYMDYQVELIWEDDSSQPDYKSIGLHGKYSTNWQEFSVCEDKLSFMDGSNRISIFVRK